MTSFQVVYSTGFDLTVLNFKNVVLIWVILIWIWMMIDFNWYILSEQLISCRNKIILKDQSCNTLNCKFLLDVKNSLQVQENILDEQWRNWVNEIYLTKHLSSAQYSSHFTYPFTSLGNKNKNVIWSLLNAENHIWWKINFSFSSPHK